MATRTDRTRRRFADGSVSVWPSGGAAQRRRGFARLVWLAVCMIVSLGCAKTARIGGSMPADEVIDELRQENDQLHEQVQTLQDQIALRLAEIEQLQHDGGSPPTPDAAAPRLAVVRFDRYSGAVDSDGDGRDDLIRLYVRTLDQDDRFLPVAGKAALRAVVMTPNEPPAELAARVYESAAFKAAYRSSFMGSHYTLELPVPADADASISNAAVQLTFTDAATGVTLSRQAEIRLDLTPSSP